MWLKYLGLGAGAVLLVAAAAWAWGTWRWQRDTEALRSALDAQREPLRVTRFHRSELAGLPAPVQRYFQRALKDEAPIIAAARFAHQGTFNMGATTARWSPFTSQQIVIAKRPGFDWHGRISAGYGLFARVHDAYVGGNGLLVAKLMGVVPLAELRDTPEMAQGEFMRWLAEACWYPTALLPSQGVLWTAVDDQSARASFSDGPTTVSLLFHFNAEGLIDRISSPARPRLVDGQVSSAAWEVRLWAYEEHSGVSIPAEGEVAWLLPSGRYPYWRARISHLEFDWAT